VLWQKNKAWAQQANVTTTGTFTQGSNVISSMASTTGVAVNQIIVSNTVLANLSSGAIVTAIINSTAVQMSQTFTGTTASGANIAFDYNHITGYNLYNNNTPNAFQNNQTVGVFNMLTVPNYITITANTIAGNNILLNPSAGFANTQTSVALTAGAATITVANTASIYPGQAVYSAAVNATTGVWSNTTAVVSVVNSTAVVVTPAPTFSNSSTSLTFSNIHPGMVASGTNIPTLAVNNQTKSTLSTSITGTISNGTIGSNGNILSVSSFTGPNPSVGQEISGTNITNGTYITTVVNSTAFYVSANSITNGASGSTTTITTLVPRVLYVNSTAIVLGNTSANTFATGNAVSNNVSFSTFEVSIATRTLGIAHAGWNEVRWGTGPVIGSAVVTSGSGFANGETITVSGGSSNGTLTITTNAAGNIASLAVTKAGAGFTNTSVATLTFDRQKHLANSTGGITSAITYSGTATGYNNTDVIAVSNTTNGIVNATATVSTNSTGGTLTITVTNVGLFAAAQANSGLVVSIANSTGGSSSGSGATFAATLGTSTGGSANVTLGGRSGRHYSETLVALTGTSPYITENAADNSVNPNS
jgi:hypothetical protein